MTQKLTHRALVGMWDSGEKYLGKDQSMMTSRI